MRVVEEEQEEEEEEEDAEEREWGEVLRWKKRKYYDLSLIIFVIN